MAQVYTELPLYSDASYQYSAAVENQSRQFRFNWNDRTKSYQMDVINEDGTSVLLGMRLVPQYPMFVDYPLSKYSMTGYFLLMPKNLNQAALKIERTSDVSERFTLFYIFEEVV